MSDDLPFTEVKGKKKKKKKKKAEKISADPEKISAQKKEPQKVARTLPKQRGGAVLIKPAQGKTFTDVVRDLRQVDTQSQGIDIRGVTKTKDGAVLLRTGRSGQIKNLSEVLRTALGTGEVIRDMTPLVTVEILDLDCLTVEADVRAALDVQIGTAADRKVAVTRPNSREQRVAICRMSGTDARALLDKGRIRIGFVSCRVRPRVEVQRCYRCLGFGHVRQSCKGPDRSTSCWKCGEEGHKGKDCKGPPACFICQGPGKTKPGHIAGSGNCPAFRAALAEAKLGATGNAVRK